MALSILQNFPDATRLERFRGPYEELDRCEAEQPSERAPQRTPRPLHATKGVPGKFGATGLQ